MRTDSISISLSEGGGTNNGSSASSSHSPYSARSNASVSSSITDVRSFTGSHNLATDDKSISNKSKKSKTNSQSLKANFMHHLGKKSPAPIRKEVNNSFQTIESIFISFFSSHYQRIMMN